MSYENNNSKVFSMFHGEENKTFEKSICKDTITNKVNPRVRVLSKVMKLKTIVCT